MQTFISDLTDAILQRHGGDLAETCVVFPSKRASVFFKEHLVQSIAETGFAPTVLTIEELVHEMRPVTILDSTSLAFELFPIYRELFPEETFDRYFSWAGMLINDFDELDRGLVDAESVFRNMFELQEIDSSIASWLNPDGKPTEFQARYLRFWEQMHPMYLRLRKRLDDNRMAMPGQAVRSLAESVRERKPVLQWKTVVFAGFNALSKAEELLIGSLIRHGQAEAYWDLDHWYTDDPMQEAGRYFRDLRQRWEREGVMQAKDWTWIGQRLQNDPKRITLTGVPKRVGQAKAAGLKLKEMLAEAHAPEHVAVVLPDENLLFPLLHSLPRELKDVNVTMGFPLRHTPLFSLVEGVVQMHENAERLQPGQEKPRFYFRDIRVLLRHPYIQNLAFDECKDVMREIEKDSLTYLGPEYFREKFGEEHILGFLFCHWDTVEEVIVYFLGLYQRIRGCLERADGSLSAFEGEYLFQFHTLTQKLRDKLDHYAVNLDQRMFRRIYRDLIQQASIPFAGEPLQGLQVMGMLETRVLDFERIIMLSVNENILPAKPRNASFIPFNLRKAFGLPVQEDKDAVYAYHFYRLLQRAKEVVLIYNTEQDTLGMGEKSRFISQIEMELAKKNPALEIVEETLTFPTNKEAVRPVSVKKDSAMLAQLRKLMNEPKEGRKAGFSPSALSAYLSCPLKFYYRYILRLSEKDELEHSMAAHTFGKVVHKVMEEFYAPFKGKTVAISDIEAMYPKVDEAVKEAFVEETHTHNYTQGKNFLLLRVIRDLVTQMLDIDKGNAPFDIVDLEYEIDGKLVTEQNPEGMSLRGFIDRVDRVDGMLRIVDYKTGAVDALVLKDYEEIKDGDKKKEAFQLATYTWMYLRSLPMPEPLMAGIYPMRNLSNGFTMLSTGPTGNIIHDKQSMLPFEDVLAGVVDEIFDVGTPFFQTEDEARCRYCAYKVMCVRS